MCAGIAFFAFAAAFGRALVLRAAFLRAAPFFVARLFIVLFLACFPRAAFPLFAGFAFIFLFTCDLLSRSSWAGCRPAASGNEH